MGGGLKAKPGWNENSPTAQAVGEKRWAGTPPRDPPGGHLPVTAFGSVPSGALPGKHGFIASLGYPLVFRT